MKKKKEYKTYKINTKYYACLMYTSTKSKWTLEQVCKRYSVKRGALMKWLKKFDGSKKSLENESKAPKTRSKRAHTVEETKNIISLINRHSKDITLNELYSKLYRD